jgi:FhaA, N-terminal domain/FHA domain
MLRGLERRIESLFEGLFGRAFRTHVQPVELARKLAKEMDEHRSVSVSRVYVPNEYTLYLSSADRSQFASYEGSLVGELQEYLTEHARREGYALLTPPRVLVATDDDLAVGEFGIATRLTESDDTGPALPPPPSAPPPVTMVYRPEEPLGADDDAPAEVAREVVTLTIGDRVVPLTTARAVIGRSREADVQVEDSNVSRRHCEVRQESAASWSVADLGSTNGTELNGERIEGDTRLAHGDRITVGGTTIVFGRTLP